MMLEITGWLHALGGTLTPESWTAAQVGYELEMEEAAAGDRVAQTEGTRLSSRSQEWRAAS